MNFNFYIVFLSALIPMLVGFVWYHPKTFGNPWMEAAEMDEEKMKGGKMGVILLLTYVLGVFISLSLTTMVVHQLSMFSLFAGEPGLQEAGTEINALFTTIMTDYGQHYRTFGHGAFHGFIFGILLLMPVIAVNALFERRGFKYIAINSGYWILTLALMGGLIGALL